MFHFNLQHWEKVLWYIRQRPSMRYLFEHACLLGCYAILNSKYQHSERSQFLHFLGQTVKEEWLVLNCLSPKWLFTPCSLVNSYWLGCLHLHSQAVQGHPWPLSRLAGLTSQKSLIFIKTAVRTSNLTSMYLLYNLTIYTSNVLMNYSYLRCSCYTYGNKHRYPFTPLETQIFMTSEMWCHDDS